jgi:hypothetical protein
MSISWRMLGISYTTEKCVPGHAYVNTYMHVCVHKIQGVTTIVIHYIPLYYHSKMKVCYAQS